MKRAGASPSPSSGRPTSIVHQSPEIIVTAHTPHIEHAREMRFSRDRIATLLGRYPNVSDEEREEILAFMKEGRHLEIGLLTSNGKVRPQLDAFMEEHKRHFRIGAADLTKLFVVFAILATVSWLVWGLIAPRAPLRRAGGRPKCRVAAVVGYSAAGR
jgi:hypothetical protein